MDPSLQQYSAALPSSPMNIAKSQAILGSLMRGTVKSFNFDVQPLTLATHSEALIISFGFWKFKGLLHSGQH